MFHAKLLFKLVIKTLRQLVINYFAAVYMCGGTAAVWHDVTLSAGVWSVDSSAVTMHSQTHNAATSLNVDWTAQWTNNMLMSTDHTRGWIMIPKHTQKKDKMIHCEMK